MRKIQIQVKKRERKTLNSNKLMVDTKYNTGVLNVLHLLPSEVRERVNRERVEGLMETLTEKERAALELRFGINGGELRSFKKMGDELGMTHTGAMKLFNRAMKKLLVEVREVG